MGMACCSAMAMPTPCGIEGLRARTSNVARISDFLPSGGM